MSLAEGVQARVAYKAYASGAITANALATSSSDLGASGAQTLRRVSASLKLAKDTYQSNEIRSDRQITDFRHGTKRVTGSVSGEFSPATYWDLFVASLRSTQDDEITLTQSDLTSIAGDGTKFSFASGDPVALGLRVGHIFRLSSATSDNSKNFVILSFGGTSNRDVTVYPPPSTFSADTSFTLATVGKSVNAPSAAFVSSKFGFEVYNEDLDIARLFTECRIGGFNLNLPATGMATVEFPVMGRDMEIYEDSEAPFFTSPAAETTTGIFAAVNGLIRVNGVNVGVVTGVTMSLNLNPSSDAVVGQNFVPEIFLGRANLTGQITADFQDADLIQNFTDEDEISVLLYLTTTSDAASPACTIFLPRIKFSDADVPAQGEAAQTLTLPFQALKYVGNGAGIENTTIQICDTEVTGS